MPRYKLVRSSWKPWEGEYHRCSNPRCGRPAVLYYVGTAGGWGVQRKHERRRFLCRWHAENAYNMVERPSGWFYRMSDSWPLRIKKREPA